METPRADIELFLCHHKIAEGRRLPAAILFADSMLKELGAAVTEWREMAAKLQQLKCEREFPSPN
jgi:hypothetical protein